MFHFGERWNELINFVYEKIYIRFVCLLSMYPGEFERLFARVSDLFTLDTISKKGDFSGKSLKRNPSTPVWDVLESLDGLDNFDLGDEKYVPCIPFFKKTIRILFFILLVEFEGRLFRIHEWNGKPLSSLNEKNINDLIRELLESDLVNFQREYSSASKFKEDLKAISSFRNVIMHVNKKLEKEILWETLVTRKAQLRKVLVALQQILDKMDCEGHVKI